MKKIGHVLLLALTLSCVFSCKKEDSQGVDKNRKVDDNIYMNFTIDGDGYKSQAMSIKGTAGIIGNQGCYNSLNDYTAAYVDDKPSDDTDYKNSASIAFAGETTGTFSVVDEDSYPNEIIIGLTRDAKSAIIIYDSNKDGSAAKINVTGYDAVGGYISGDFTATLFNPGNGNVVHITNGHFKVKRTADFKG